MSERLEACAGEIVAEFADPEEAPTNAFEVVRLILSRHFGEQRQHLTDAANELESAIYHAERHNHSGINLEDAKAALAALRGSSPARQTDAERELDVSVVFHRGSDDSGAFAPASWAGEGSGFTWEPATLILRGRPSLGETETEP